MAQVAVARVSAEKAVEAMVAAAMAAAAKALVVWETAAVAGTAPVIAAAGDRLPKGWVEPAAEVTAEAKVAAAEGSPAPAPAPSAAALPAHLMRRAGSLPNVDAAARRYALPAAAGKARARHSCCIGCPAPMGGCQRAACCRY